MGVHDVETGANGGSATPSFRIVPTAGNALNIAGVRRQFLNQHGRRTLYPGKHGILQVRKRPSSAASGVNVFVRESKSND